MHWDLSTSPFVSGGAGVEKFIPEREAKAVGLGLISDNGLNIIIGEKSLSSKDFLL